MAVQKVKRRGRVMWRARVIRNGVERTAFRSRRDEAVEAETQLIEELSQPPREEVPTVEQFSHRWLEHQAAENKPGEVMRKQSALRLHILPAFGDRLISDVDTKSVDRFKTEKLSRLKPATVAGLITVLKRMLNVAARWGVINKAPLIDQVKVPKVEIDFLDFGEAEAFLEAASSWRTFMLTAMRTGLRVGELRALRWSDVDLERKRIRVARSYTRAGMGTPKSGKARTVYMTWDLIEALAARRKDRGLVFPTSNGTPLQYKTIYEACCRTSRAAGLGRVMAPHGLRHTFGAHHSMKGTDMLRLKEWMGHADLRTTLIYSHLSETARSEHADNIAPPQVGPGEPSRTNQSPSPEMGPAVGPSTLRKQKAPFPGL